MLTYKDAGQMLLLLSVGVLPPFAGFFLGASSMALGIFIFFILLLLVKLERLPHILCVHKSIFIFLVISLFYALIQQIFIGVWATKSFFSIVALLLVFIIAYFLSKEILFQRPLNRNSIFILFWFLVFFAFLAIVTDFGIGYLVYGHNKSIFPFGEPSHFALFFGPFFLMIIAMTESRLIKLLYIFLVTTLALLIPSTTLLIYVLLALGLMIRFSKSSIFVFIPLLVAAIYTLLTDSYFLSRLILSNDSKNLTALVYLQGLQDAYNSIESTLGLGLGFQMLGTQPASLAGEQLKYLMGGDYLNRQDGGFLAAKIIAEFGVYGFFILVSYLVMFFKAFTNLKNGMFLNSEYPLASVFSLCFIYASFVEFFVRGVGYFSPSLFFFFVALFLHSMIPRQRCVNGKH
ncbi:hypothetical protein [Shewanella holmiensis]|uniref:Uncharacterized protein n=1 Tax=Shewanella holmiensis TaxID=2952222 RepID=A0A9X2WPG8_9GAMM|nr:hypothetical protein [Shewanella holmiensis]MCT7942953.1 hypothetical protein [Shewanella holmiensis]